MQDYPQLNLMVQSSNVKALIRIMPEIDNHQGGFTIADKSLPIDTFLMRMEWAMLGLTHTKDLQTDVEVKPEWLEVMRLAFEEGLQDKAIALSMHKSERMIRHYWSKIQDALEIYPEEGKNMRAQTQKKARDIGLID
jgi:DNA-binding NarL/FixJ family response regulator